MAEPSPTLDAEPRWLPIDIVIDNNIDTVCATGEPFLILDEGLLSSAYSRPQNMWAYGGVTDVVTLAAALAIGIGRNHPFQQGNKRTAFESAVMFLYINGYDVIAPDTVLLGVLLEAVIIGDMAEDAYIRALRSFVFPH